MRWGLGEGVGGGRQRDDESRGASVSWVDGDVADDIRPSHCERGDVDT